MSTVYNQFRCTYCGAIFSDKDSWDHHMVNCFSKTTMCTLCGSRMPTAHKEEHLRIIHGLKTTSLIPSSSSTMYHSSNNNSNNQSSNYFASMRNGSDPRTAKIAKKMQLLSENASVFPISDLNNRPLEKSSTLSKMMQQPRSKSPSPSYGSHHNHQQGEMMSTKRSTTPKNSSAKPSSSAVPATGFSFRSSEKMLQEAASSKRMEHLLAGNYDAIEVKRERKDNDNNSSSINSNHQRRSSSPSSSKQKFDIRSQQQLAVVEEVVQNIMTRSPGRDSMVNNNGENEKRLKLLSAAANYQTAGRHYFADGPGSGLSSLNQQRHGQQGVTSLRAGHLINNDMTACANCGKVVISLEKHQCEAESTSCPKCGETVSLLSFDRHFLNCAVGAQWSAIREKKEMERLIENNAGSFRRSKSSATFGRQQSMSGFKSSATFGSFKEDDDNNLSSGDFGNDLKSNSGKKRQQQSKSSFAFLPKKHSDLGLSVDEGSFAGGAGNNDDLQPQKSSLDLFKEARSGMFNNKNNKSSSSFHQQQQQQQQRKPSIFSAVSMVDETSSSSSHNDDEDEDKNDAPPPGFRPCVLCNQLIHESQLADHLDKCDSNLLSCSLCKQGVPAHAVEEHKLFCEANRRRCPFCSTSIQFSRLPDHVSKCCEDQGSVGNGKMTMYHGTSEKSAKTIVTAGFLPSQSGLLGEGVYMTRDMTKAKTYGPVIIEALVTIPGKILTVSKIGHRMQKTWQVNGFDAAWIPQGVSKSGLEEHCIKNPHHIAVVKMTR